MPFHCSAKVLALKCQLFVVFVSSLVILHCYFVALGEPVLGLKAFEVSFEQLGQALAAAEEVEHSMNFFSVGEGVGAVETKVQSTVVWLLGRWVSSSFHYLLFLMEVHPLFSFVPLGVWSLTSYVTILLAETLYFQ